MVFSSETFLFVFLPLFLVSYLVTPFRFKSISLLLGSYLFYAWWRGDFLFLLISVTVWSFFFGRAVSATEQDTYKKILLFLGVAGCLGVLGYFKYANFFIDSLAALVGTTAAELGFHWQVILPIGISFYVFQAVSYLVDAYRGDVDDNPSLIDYAAFLSLFPQLIAGPILRYKDLAPQFKERAHSWALFSTGIKRFVVGLAMKIIIADNLAPLADLAFEQERPDLVLAWLGSIAYAFQLFFDFAGYSAMAIGLGLMMGFKFAENFNAPYHSRSITEFWRRWHISLSTYLRDYLYIPLGGNRVGPVRTYVNLIAVMVLGGLWHGAAWTFVIWGFWHGGCLALERASGQDRRAADLWWSWPLTIILVLIGWIMFRAATPGDALAIYSGMLGFYGVEMAPHVAVQVTKQALIVLVGAAIVSALEPRVKDWVASDAASDGLPVWHGQSAASAAVAIASPVIITLLFLVSVTLLAEASNSPFLYFQF